MRAIRTCEGRGWGLETGACAGHLNMARAQASAEGAYVAMWFETQMGVQRHATKHLVLCACHTQRGLHSVCLSPRRVSQTVILADVAPGDTDNLVFRRRTHGRANSAGWTSRDLGNSCGIADLGVCEVAQRQRQRLKLWPRVADHSRNVVLHSVRTFAEEIFRFKSPEFLSTVPS